MKHLVLVSSLLVASDLIAEIPETHICVTEAVSGVSETADGRISASVFSASKTFLYTRDDGRWVVKESGVDFPLYDDCNGGLCQGSGGFTGAFLINKESRTFTAQWFSIHGDDVETWFVGKGRCNEI
jgi:hypothetical protein